MTGPHKARTEKKKKKRGIMKFPDLVDVSLTEFPHHIVDLVQWEPKDFLRPREIYAAEAHANVTGSTREKFPLLC
jgi:hypothetical protein